MEKTIVSLINVEKSYGSNTVVKTLNMNVAEGEFLTILGPSGCGKTTTLRMIAGFEMATSGIIEVEGEKVENKEAYERNVNTVFQNYALFPHMSVYDNIAYGLVVKGAPKSEIQNRVAEMLELVQLKGFEKRKPTQMSGGQKQRVAIARALINRPKVLLLDEPLGALDLKLRKQMQIELKRLQKKLKITFIYVTHDQEEALTMSDRIAVMNAGRLEQIGTPREIYESPKTRFVASFIGESNLFEGIVNSVDMETLTVTTENGNVWTKSAGAFQPREGIFVSVRPENVNFSATAPAGFSLRGTVKELIYVGSIIKAIVVLQNGQEIKINRSQLEERLEVDSCVYIYWDQHKAVSIKDTESSMYDYLKRMQKELIDEVR